MTRARRLGLSATRPAACAVTASVGVRARFAYYSSLCKTALGLPRGRAAPDCDRLVLLTSRARTLRAGYCSRRRARQFRAQQTSSPAVRIDRQLRRSPSLVARDLRRYSVEVRLPLNLVGANLASRDRRRSRRHDYAVSTSGTWDWQPARRPSFIKRTISATCSCIPRRVAAFRVLDRRWVCGRGRRTVRRRASAPASAASSRPISLRARARRSALSARAPAGLIAAIRCRSLKARRSSVVRPAGARPIGRPPCRSRAPPATAASCSWAGQRFFLTLTNRRWCLADSQSSPSLLAAWGLPLSYAFSAAVSGSRTSGACARTGGESAARCRDGCQDAIASVAQLQRLLERWRAHADYSQLRASFTRLRTPPRVSTR